MKGVRQSSGAEFMQLNAKKKKILKEKEKKNRQHVFRFIFWWIHFNRCVKCPPRLGEKLLISLFKLHGNFDSTSFCSFFGLSFRKKKSIEEAFFYNN